MYILNYNGSFLLDRDSFSFIFKRQYHTNFELNIVNFTSTLPHGPPLNTLRGSQCAQASNCVIFHNTCKTQNFFCFWLMSWFTDHTFKRWWGLEICHMVADCILFKQWIYCSFLLMVGVQGQNIGHFW